MPLFLASQSENSSTEGYSHTGKTCLWLTCWDCFSIFCYEWRILSSLMWHHVLWQPVTSQHGITSQKTLIFILIAMKTIKFTSVVCVQMKVLPVASQFIGVWHLAVALQAVGLEPPHPHANSQFLLMEHRPVHAHALQQDLSVQAVGLLPGKAKTVYLCKLYILQWMASYGQHLLKCLTITVL